MSASAAAAHVEANVVPGPTRAANVLMLKVHVEDAASAAVAVHEAAVVFKREHARSALALRGVVVTLVGALGAAAFAAGWRTLERADPALGQLTRGLSMAEVMSGAPSGQVLERVSLRG